MSRIVVSSTTPTATEREHSLFQIMMEPERRNGADIFGALTLGHVLDAPIVSCAYRSAVHSETWDAIFIRTAARCGRRSCPNCIIVSLHRVADAWTVWHGSAYVLLTDSHRTPFKMRGDDAVPAVVSVPVEDGRMYFSPSTEQVEDAVLYAGAALDDTLKRAVRAVPLERHERKKPADHIFMLPRTWGRDEILRACRVVGITPRFQGNGRIRMDHASRQQFRDLREYAWGDRARLAGGQGPVGEVGLGDKVRLERAVTSERSDDRGDKVRLDDPPWGRTVGTTTTPQLVTENGESLEDVYGRVSTNGDHPLLEEERVT